MTKEKEEKIVWKAAEFEYREKDVSWYWIFATVFVILGMIALWQKNFFFLVFLIVAGAVAVFFSRRRPRVLEFKIDDNGISIGSQTRYPFKDFEGFDIHKRPGRLDELVFRHKGYLRKIVRLPIDSELGREAAIFLEKRLRRAKYEETLIDVISDWVGF